MNTIDDSCSNSPKDVFLQLLSFTALCISIIGFIGLMFQYVNLSFNMGQIYYTGIIEDIHWYMALLIIATPTYLYTLRSIAAEIKIYPRKAEIKTRKWLIHLTLFIVAIIFLISLMTILYYFLSGDLTTSFLLKVIVILIAITPIYFFYKHDLTKPWEIKSISSFAVVTILVMLIIVGYGFYKIGTPAKARAIKLDNLRINNLNSIQTQIYDYWKQKGKLPTSTSELAEAKLPVDPKTSAAYPYQVLSDLSFQLCANFELPTMPYSEQPLFTPYGINIKQADNWKHAAGYVCFTRTIDATNKK